MARVEVAIWHPTLSATEIEERATAQARVALSVGSPRRPGSGIYPETYCKFDLGQISFTKESEDLAALEKFRRVVSMEDFSVPGALWIAYFEINEDESEVYLGRSALTYLAQMGFGIVFRAP